MTQRLVSNNIHFNKVFVNIIDNMCYHLATQVHQCLVLLQFLLTYLFDPPVDSLLELSLHKVALKPVSAHLYSCIQASRTDDGSLERLKSNLSVLERKGTVELGGSAGVGVPDSVALERIQQRWISMHEAYSPNKKVQILLKVCKSIYHSMSANASSGIQVSC